MKETLKNNKTYKVIYKGKFVNNYAWREPTNPNLFVLGNEMVNSWTGSEIKKLGWDHIKEITIIEL